MYLNNKVKPIMATRMQFFFLKLFVISVSSRTVAVGKEENSYLPASDAQKNYIMQSVCTDLMTYLKTEAVQQCKEDFGWHMDRDQSGFQIRCRSDSSVTLEVPTSNLYQVVLLVPDPSVDDDDPYSVLYSIISPKNKYVVIDSSPDTDYKTFSTVLDRHGRPIVWHHESRVHSWEVPASRDYDIRARFQNTTNSTDALFTWNKIGELDACFELVTRCDKSDRTIIKKIWPDSLPIMKVGGLPLNDSCFAKLSGLYGTTRFDFHTPASKVPAVEAEEPEFTYPQDVVIVAEEDGDRWTVRVAWPAPAVVPDSYNVTLRADSVTTVVVPGNATEAVLRGITGKGFYNVSVYAILGREVAHTSRRALFPSGGGSWRWAGAAGGAWGAVAVASTAAALYWLRFCRSRILPPAKGKIMNVKPADDSCVESVHVESWAGGAGGAGGAADGWEVKLERLLLHEVIGEGAFGVVRRGTLAPNGKEVAVKMLKDFPSVDEMRAFRAEMEVMKSVGAHPHVVSLVGCCSGRHPLIVAEYCSHGDLLNFLRCSWDVMVSKRNANYYNNNINTSDYRNDLFKCKPQEHSRLVVNKMYDLEGVCDTELTSLDLLSFCRQIAMGMEFLALNKLVHRDLAARNILVTRDRTLKIADFGLSRDVYEENQYKQKGNGKMPIKWMALESLTRRIYTTQSDVWSFGVVMWEVVTVGAAPYPGVAAARLPRLLRAGYRMPRPPNCSKQLYELMLSCWRACPRSRPTFAALHARLDALLLGAAGDYLSLELDHDPPPHHNRYLQIILRAKRSWTRGESYERPVKALRNHYTSPPVTLNRTPA